MLRYPAPLRMLARRGSGGETDGNHRPKIELPGPKGDVISNKEGRSPYREH